MSITPVVLDASWYGHTRSSVHCTGCAAYLSVSGIWVVDGSHCWHDDDCTRAHGRYNSSADIWSFGITILELAHGHAPFARYPPMKVLLMTIQNPPPSLESDSKKHFSKVSSWHLLDDARDLVDMPLARISGAIAAEGIDTLAALQGLQHNCEL